MAFFVDGLTIKPTTVSQVRRIGEFTGLQEALLAAEKIISDFLLSEYQPGMLPSTLFARYKAAGEVPYIFRDDGEITQNIAGFNHFRFALSCCTELANSHTIN